MNILMVSNTYTPCVGGVTKSVEQFVEQFRQRAHQVVVATSSYKLIPHDEFDIVRFPAIHHFNGSDFSWPLPVPGKMAAALKRMPPDVVHSHHPFVLGGTALRAAAAHNVPLVFTYHTMYEKYSHYMSVKSWRLKRYLISLITGYCNFCDHVIAPSESVQTLLRARGVTVPIHVIPTGIDTAFYASGDGVAARQQYAIPTDAFVVGHVGRLASEKNLAFLALAVAQFLAQQANAWFVVAGAGPLEAEIQAVCEQYGVQQRLIMTGLLRAEQLRDLYQAMDVFAFTSLTETQGMVVTEAMAAGVPVVALDAPGVREVVKNESNGRLIIGDQQQFCAALQSIAELDAAAHQRLCEAAISTAAEFDLENTATRVLSLYQNMMAEKQQQPPPLEQSANLRMLAVQWNIAMNIARAAACIPRAETWQPDRFCDQVIHQQAVYDE